VLVLIEEYLLTDKTLHISAVSVDHIEEMVIEHVFGYILMML
jgi:hypothetical protein